MRSDVMNARHFVLLTLVPSLTVASCDMQHVPSSDVAAPPAKQPALSGKILHQAIEDWIGLLEADDLESASQRWAKDDQVTEQLTQRWQRLRKCHTHVDYRNWIDRARNIGEHSTFKVGGHSYGSLHIDWIKTPEGWRIGKVWVCR
jgi:hypothetical protein